MKSNGTRIVISLNKVGEVVLERQRLSKHPSGNAAQRAKALRSGWHPEWVSYERPRPFVLSDLEQFSKQELEGAQ